jgi:uncharacterized protein (DUF1697 family)
VLWRTDQREDNVTAYVAFLRAINVGGNNGLPMEKLAEIMAELGHGGVKTHLQSGNVVFTSHRDDEQVLTAEIEAAIEQGAGFRPAVMLRSRSEMEAVVAANPLLSPEVNPARMLTVFLRERPPAEGIAKLEPERFPNEKFAVVGREMYVLYDDGMGNSKFTPAYYERRLNVPGTGRNWNTVTKVLALMTI